MLLLLVHIQRLKSSSCQFIYLKETSLCFVCVSSKRSRVFCLWQTKLTIWIQLNPLFAKSLICWPNQPQYPRCNDSLAQVKDSCQLTSVSLQWALSWEEQPLYQGKALDPMPLLHFPPKTCFTATKLVRFYAVSIVPASFTLFLSLSSFADFLATSRLCCS